MPVQTTESGKNITQLNLFIMSLFQILRSTSPTSHRVPPHSELLMPDTQCRVCGNILSRANARKQHEILRHRLTFVDGETFSPTPYVIPFTSAAPAPTTSPTSAISGASRVLFEGGGTRPTTNTAQTSSSGSPSVTTVGGQAETSGSNTVSPTPMSIGSVSVSPTPVSLGSDRSLSPVSAPSDDSSTAPAIFLTPTNPQPRRRNSSRASSASPMTRAHPVLPARSSSVSPNQQHSPGELRCRYCLLTFTNRYYLNRHSLHCQFTFDPSVNNRSDYCVLTRPPNHEQTAQILQQLTLSNKINICKLNRWAIPNIWPLVFPRNLRPIPPILNEMTAFRESTHILRGLLQSEQEVTLPGKVLLIDEARGIQSVLPSRYLTPGTAFVSRSTAEEIIVSPGIMIRLMIFL